ncbi:hypothetical protein HZC30_05095 [Candidatus Woesearchaeota archaeon]|nr:hypothetical protein [Candidatus Woesearchaeota archaeon]
MTKSELWENKIPGRSELLVKYGFIKQDKKEKYEYNEKSSCYEPREGDKLEAGDADDEEIEVAKELFKNLGYPSSLKTYHLTWEVHDLSLEEPYFWVLDVLKENFPEIIKLEDAFAASENSAFFGITQQRLGAQQDKVSQYLATAGKMVKELFQMVRELRILDERLNYYNKVAEQLGKPMSQRDKGSDITLKGIFVDLVQGGGKSASSIFGMARELEFITLPDLFFDAPPFKDETEITNHIESLRKDFNQSVLRVLHRHLVQYISWRASTHKEHTNRRGFMLRYLLQHFEIIKMYLAWTKPYLKHVARLHLKESGMGSAELVSAFEGSLLDIEFLARKKQGGGANSCILATFNYRTRPELKVVQEGYQRGPVHIGKMEMFLRAYAWTDRQVEMYQKLKEKETMLLMAEVSGSVYSAMEALGEELDKYIAEAQGKSSEEEEKKSAKPDEDKSIWEKLFGDFYTPKKVKAKANKKPKKSAQKAEQELPEKLKSNAVVKPATIFCWQAYNNFKKAHGMIAW